MRRLLVGHRLRRDSAPVTRFSQGRESNRGRRGPPHYTSPVCISIHRSFAPPQAEFLVPRAQPSPSSSNGRHGRKGCGCKVQHFNKDNYSLTGLGCTLHPHQRLTISRTPPGGPKWSLISLREHTPEDRAPRGRAPRPLRRRLPMARRSQCRKELFQQMRDRRTDDTGSKKGRRRDDAHHHGSVIRVARGRVKMNGFKVLLKSDMWSDGKTVSGC